MNSAVAVLTASLGHTRWDRGLPKASAPPSGSIPVSLMECLPVGHFTNAVLQGLNEVRRCLPEVSLPLPNSRLPSPNPCNFVFNFVFCCLGLCSGVITYGCPGSH